MGKQKNDNIKQSPVYIDIACIIGNITTNKLTHIFRVKNAFTFISSLSLKTVLLEVGQKVIFIPALQMA